MQSSGASKAFRVVVEYCGSCGYGKYFNTISKAIKDKYPSAEVNGQKIPGGTGCLEVKIFPDPASTEEHLIHSKLNGDGTVTDKNIAGVMSKLDQVLKL